MKPGWWVIALAIAVGAGCSSSKGQTSDVGIEGDPSAPDDGSSPHEEVPPTQPPPTQPPPVSEPEPLPEEPMAFFPIRSSPIATENARPGSRGWKLTVPSRSVGAFVDRTSYLPGETVRAFAAGPTAGEGSWELWRFGYYGGSGGRLILEGAPVQIQQAADPLLDPATGAVSAPWAESFRFTLPDDAVTGVYAIKLTAPAGQTYALFVVREKEPAAPIVYPVAFNTYAAYNSWGGTSLYTNRRTDFAGRHAYASSFDRPFSSGNGLGSFSQKDRPFITFAEAQGYDIAYASDVDLSTDPRLTWGRRVLLIQGHSEYWTGAMRAQADAAVKRGTHLLNLGANNAYWQVRLAPAADGRPNRLVVGYRDETQAKDPVYLNGDRGEATAQFRDSAVGRPENALFGTMFGDWILNAAPLVVRNADHWIWTGTGVSDGDLIPGVFGDEVDHRFANGHEPEGLVVLGEGTVETYEGLLGGGEMTFHVKPSGAEVFSGGSITWSQALADEGVWDRRIQQVLANLLSRYAGDGTLGPEALKPMVLSDDDVVVNRFAAPVTTIARGLTSPSAIAFEPSGNAVVADGNRIVRVTPQGQIQWIAGADEPGDNPPRTVLRNGLATLEYPPVPVAAARFRGPRGLAIDATGRIFVADTKNHRIRMIADGQVHTLAGRWEGYADGAGAAARFTQPMSLALTARGTVLVADMWNHRIREVTADGTVTTFAGSGALDLRNGPGGTASLHYPMSVSVRSDGAVVITEAASGVVRMIADTPGREVSILAGAFARTGWADGSLSDASVFETTAAIAKGSGMVLLLDGATARVRKIWNGQVETLAGGFKAGTIDGSGSDAGFGFLRGGAIAPDGSLWVVDSREGTVRRVALP